MIDTVFTCTRAWKPSSSFFSTPFPLLQHCWSVSFLSSGLQKLYLFRNPFRRRGCVLFSHCLCLSSEDLSLFFLSFWDGSVIALTVRPLFHFGYLFLGMAFFVCFVLISLFLFRWKHLACDGVRISRLLMHVEVLYSLLYTSWWDACFL